jgi:ABC-type transporter Mla subunit MlaD
MATNLFDDLKKALQELKDFLADKEPLIEPAIKALKGLGLPIGDLLTELITLLNKLKTEIKNLDTSQVPVLNDVSAFTASVRAALEAAKTLLPDEAADIDKVLGIADVVTSLPSLDQIKQEITDLIDAIVADLDKLNKA